MRRLLLHPRAPSPSRRALISRALVTMRLGLIFSHRLSHLIPLCVMWLVCLNLVSEALIAPDYQRNRVLESSAELPALTGSGASGSGASPADSSPSSPIAPPLPEATVQAPPPAAPNLSQPASTALPTGQPAPATAPTPMPALFPTPEPVPAQPTLAPTPTAAITTVQPPTPSMTVTPAATTISTPISPSTPTPTLVPKPKWNLHRQRIGQRC